MAPRGKTAKNWVFERLEDRHMMAANFAPNDPYFVFQWPLLNTGGPNIGDQSLQPTQGTPGEDINVVPAWQYVNATRGINGLSGNGVRVAIVSTGVQIDHPDLAANISPNFAYDVISGFDLTSGSGLDIGLPDLFTASEAAGTALAGIVGAVANNNEGIVGIAYESELVPVKLLTGGFGTDPFNLNRDGIDPNALADLFNWENQNIDIYLHAWGPNDALSQIDGASPQELNALRNSVLLGRGGLGNIHIFQAGDGAGEGVGNFSGPTLLGANDFAGYNGYVNSRYTIGVTAVDHDGQAANEDGTLTRYAEIAPAVLVAAPSGSFSGFGVIDEPSVGTGIWTTDYFVDPADALAQFLNGYNAPTVNMLEPDDLVIDPLTGITLQDRFADADYTSRFSGTGAAAAHVAGVVALMLEADRTANNGFSTLSYRDVQEILVRSARQNAPFEKLQTGEDQGSGLEYPETWVTNRNENFHDPDDFDPFNIDIFETFMGMDFQTNIGIFGSVLDHIYAPLIDPSIPFHWANINDTPTFSPVSLYTNGAGYTVSQGRTYQGSELGYGHGVVDAELAVKLAAEWSAKGQTLAGEETFTTFAQIPFGNNLPAVEIGAPIQQNQGIGTVIVPGRLGGGSGFISYYNEYGTDTPFDTPVLFQQGRSIEVSVPPPRDLSVEWVDVKLTISSGEIDNLRVTLVSPSGVHSELNHYFDTRDGTEFHQYRQDVVNDDTAGSPESLAGNGPGGPGDADGGDLFYTFSTNRHWGERARDLIQIDPATGMPYNGQLSLDDQGNVTGDPTRTGWTLLFENYGTEALVMPEYEIAWHGTPIEAETRRIQGFVGVDDNRDGRFNFDRYIQRYQDLFPRESFFNDGVDFKRLGELERFADETQENFADNVTVELWSRTQEQIAAGDTQGTLVKQFITGDDGNYYFDVVPPVNPDLDSVGFNIDIEFLGGLTETQRAAFTTAAARWESIITADLPDVMTEGGIFIDDLLITAEGTEIDDVGGILGAAGPRIFRNDGSMLPATGAMRFDSADLAQLEADGQLLDVILHEMGHVLGIGTIWEDLGFVVQSTTAEAGFNGPQALAEYNSVFGTNAPSIPIELGVQAHWDEDIFGNELMTPIISAVGTPNPISSITIAMLADLGYTVDMTQADPYTPPAAPGGGAGGGSGGGGLLDLRGRMIQEENEPVFAPVINLGGGGSNGGAGGMNAIVEYIVRVSDGEGRGDALQDFNAPNDFLPKYQTEWVLDHNYFTTLRHEGRAPEYERDANGDIIPSPFDVIDLYEPFPDPLPEGFMPVGPETVMPSAGNLIGGLTYNPARDYDIPLDADGKPIPFLYATATGTPLGYAIDDIFGVNFLMNRPAAEMQPGFNTVTLTGEVFNDKDDNGLFDGEDVQLGNVVVYADLNVNGRFDPGEPSVMTDDTPGSEGDFAISFETTTTRFFQIGVVAPTGFNLGTPASGLLNALVSPGDGTVSGFDFALIPEPEPDPDPDPGPDPGPDPDPDPGPDPSTVPGRIGGVIFEDANGDRVRQSSEGGVSGVRVYVDDNLNQQYDVGELFTFSNQFGAYDLSNIPPGAIAVRIDVMSPFTQTTPTGVGSIFRTLPANGNIRGLTFGVRNLATRDFGDLGGLFPTLESSAGGLVGASHVVGPSLYLGNFVDAELDGQPTLRADGDDNDGPPNDDDGVGLILIDNDSNGLISAGDQLNFNILANGIGAVLNAWIDFNGDGVWGPGEQIFTNVDINPGLNTTGNANPSLRLPVVTAPAGTDSTKVLGARFRYGSPNLQPTGPDTVGEVEDYLYNITNLSGGSTLLGDYDQNGVVDSIDKAVWQANYGATGANVADGNGDGIVDSIDYAIWRENLGQSAAGSGGGGEAAAMTVASDPFDLDAWYAAATSHTGLGSYDLDSALASVGVARELVTEGGVEQTAFYLLPGANLAAATQMLESIGVEVSPRGDGGSGDIAAAEASDLDLALALVAFEAAEDDPAGDDGVLVPVEEARIGDEDEALAVALEEEFAESETAVRGYRPMAK